MAITLGIHIGHDGGCALVKDDEVVVACHEERLTRSKYANGWWNALRYCLDAAGLRLSDLDAIAFSNAGDRLPEGFDGGLGSWSDALPPIHIVDHHLSHALSAYCFSPFDQCLIFVGDAGGNDAMTESAFVVDRTRWERVGGSAADRPRAGGLGTTYEAFTNFLGFRDQESGKTMALAAYGQPEAILDIPLFTVDQNGGISSRLEQPHHWGVLALSAAHTDYLGAAFPQDTSDRAANIAAYIQHQFTTALVEAIGYYHRSAPYPIVMSGGVALNCVSNQVLRRRLGRDRFYAFPACSDAGLPLGNAFYSQWALEGRLPKPRNKSMRFGRNYEQREIERALVRHPDTVPPGDLRLGDLVWQRADDAVKVAAQHIECGAIVAWWQGRSEIGPRALGGRSLLANPRKGAIRKMLNEKVKNREWFRPFAPSLLVDRAAEVIAEEGSYPYMNFAPLATSHGRERLPEAVHVDGSMRAQTVTDSDAPELASLLRELDSLGLFPAVINTSFNVREPIVETPGDAIATFLRSRIDVLIMGEYICYRHIPQ